MQVGDLGQRYEVSYQGGDGERHIMGWANHLEGVTAMLESIQLHPVWRAAQIHDRREKCVVSLGEIS